MLLIKKHYSFIMLTYFLPFKEYSIFVSWRLLIQVNSNEKTTYLTLIMYYYATLFPRVFYGSFKKHETKKYWPWWNVGTCNYY